MHLKEFKSCILVKVKAYSLSGGATLAEDNKLIYALEFEFQC